MGYENLVLPVGDWRLELSHNDEESQVSITAANGVAHYVRLSREQAQQLKQHLNHTLPYHQNDAF